MMRNTLLFLVIVIFVFLTQPLFAGWVIVQKTYDASEGGDEASVETLYLQDDKVKMVSEDFATVFDLNSGMIYFLNYQTKAFWKGTPKDMEAQVKSAMDEMIEQQLVNVPDDKKAEMRAMYEQMMSQHGDEDDSATEQEHAVSVKLTDEVMEIAGHKVYKYIVMVDGNVSEEVWLNTDAGIQNDFSVSRFYKFMSEFMKDFQDQETYHDQDAYIEMAKKGYPFRTVQKSGVYETITEVVSVESKVLTDSDFLPPDDFSEQALKDMQSSF